MPLFGSWTSRTIKWALTGAQSSRRPWGKRRCTRLRCAGIKLAPRVVTCWRNIWRKVGGWVGVGGSVYRDVPRVRGSLHGLRWSGWSVKLLYPSFVFCLERSLCIFYMMKSRFFVRVISSYAYPLPAHIHTHTHSPPPRTHTYPPRARSSHSDTAAQHRPGTKRNIKRVLRARRGAPAPPLPLCAPSRSPPQGAFRPPTASSSTSPLRLRTSAFCRGEKRGQCRMRGSGQAYRSDGGARRSGDSLRTKSGRKPSAV